MKPLKGNFGGGNCECCAAEEEEYVVEFHEGGGGWRIVSGGKERLSNSEGGREHPKQRNRKQRELQGTAGCLSPYTYHDVLCKVPAG
jgi:hypothetical protein